MTTSSIRYIGTEPLREESITGSKRVWDYGQIQTVDTVIATQLLTTGLFEDDAGVYVQAATDTSGNVTGLVGPGGTTPIRIMGPRSIMWLGDSLTQSGGYQRHPLTDHNRGYYYKTSFPNIGANMIRYARVHPECPVGNGTLRYWVADNTFTWQAFGDAEGPKVSAATGFVVAESGSPNHGIYLAVLDRLKPGGNAADTVNVQLSDGPNVVRCHLSGFTGWAELLMGCPFDTSLNYGISGATTSDIWQFRSTWQNVGTEISVVHLGTNQTPDMAGAQQSIIDLENIIRARLAAGSKVVACTLFPADALNAAYAGAKEWHRQETLRLCRRLGVPVADGFSRLAHPTATDGSYRHADVTKDGLHLSGKGCYIFAAKELVPILQKLIEAPTPRASAGIPWNATTSPTGNLLTNGGFGVGIAGTKGARLTGDVANSWTAGMYGGSVGACVATAPTSASPVARADGYPGNWMQFAINNTGGVANEYFQMYQSTFVSGSNYAAGEYLMTEAEFRLSGNGITQLSVATGPANYKTYAVYMDGSDSLGDLDGDTVNVFARSFPLKIETGQTNVNATVVCALAANGTATWQMADMTTRKCSPI